MQNTDAGRTLTTAARGSLAGAVAVLESLVPHDGECDSQGCFYCTCPETD